MQAYTRSLTRAPLQQPSVASSCHQHAAPITPPALPGKSHNSHTNLLLLLPLLPLR